MPCTASWRAAASRVDAASTRTASGSAKRTTLVAVVAVALVAATVAPAAAAGRGKRHTVRKGDTLSLLAIEHGMDKRKGWRRLYNANPRVADPNRIERGTRLYIPRYGETFERRRLPSRRDVASRASRGASGSAPTRGVWARLAACESSGNWAANTGNGYYGGLQFSLASWRAVGGRGYPHRASPARQIAMAERLLARQGWSAWPGCSRKLGLR